MATFRVSHSGCNDDLEVISSDVTLLSAPNSTEGSYRFCCPECKEIVIKPADQRLMSLLLDYDVKRETITIEPSSELAEEVRRETSPPTDDDILDFHEALRDTTDVIGLFEGIDPEELMDAYREHVDTIEIDEHLFALKDLFEAHGLNGEDLFNEIRNRYTEGLGLPPEDDIRNDGPAGDINQA